MSLLSRSYKPTNHFTPPFGFDAKESYFLNSFGILNFNRWLQFYAE